MQAILTSDSEARGWGDPTFFVKLRYLVLFKNDGENSETLYFKNVGN